VQDGPDTITTHPIKYRQVDGVRRSYTYGNEAIGQVGPCQATRQMQGGRNKVQQRKRGKEEKGRRKRTEREKKRRAEEEQAKPIKKPPYSPSPCQSRRVLAQDGQEHLLQSLNYTTAPANSGIPTSAHHRVEKKSSRGSDERVCTGATCTEECELESRGAKAVPKATS